MAAGAAAATQAETTLPQWLSNRAPAEASPAPPLRPSNALAAGEPDRPPPSSERHAALERGRLIHTLLQYLPEVDAARRRGAAETFLDARGGGFRCERARIADRDGARVLDMPALAGLFAPHARAEVALAGAVTLPDGKTREVLGQIDRIAESDNEILIADFKTGTPAAAGATPETYLAQMRSTAPCCSHSGPANACGCC